MKSELIERQIERRLELLRDVGRKPPAKGWVHTIRSAIGMSSPELARRIGMTRQGVSEIERRERDGSVSLAVLQKAAEGMDCDLVYAIVPRKSLAELMKEQARKKATDEIRRVVHTMLLENQGTALEETDRLIEERADQLLRGSRRALWSEVPGDGEETPSSDSP